MLYTATTMPMSCTTRTNRPAFRTPFRALMLLLPLIVLSACGDDDPQRAAETADSTRRAEAPHDMPSTSTLDLPQADPAIAADTHLLRTPDGQPSMYAIEKGRIVFRVVGDRAGRVEQIFRDYGRYDRRIDSSGPASASEPMPPVHEMTLTTPAFVGKYDYALNQGWQMPIDPLYVEYLRSDVSDSLSLVEFQMVRNNAKRLPDTTLNGYETRVYRLDGGPVTVTLWMWRGMAIRSHFVIPANDISFTYEPVSIELDVATPDELFAFPAGAKIAKREGPPSTDIIVPPTPQ